MADQHEHGKMDTTEHEKTFAGFVNFAKWTVIVIIAVLVFLALFRT
ncbi:MAG: aa3-type cytochrome c oxidase subunit IV [Pseudomonadota bacterium]